MADHYIGCVVDFPDCLCLRCANDSELEFGEGEVCCQEHGRDCRNGGRCRDFIDEEDAVRTERYLAERDVPPADMDGGDDGHA